MCKHNNLSQLTEIMSWPWQNKGTMPSIGANCSLTAGYIRVPRLCNKGSDRGSPLLRLNSVGEVSSEEDTASVPVVMNDQGQNMKYPHSHSVPSPAGHHQRLAHSWWSGLEKTASMMPYQGPSYQQWAAYPYVVNQAPCVSEVYTGGYYMPVQWCPQSLPLSSIVMNGVTSWQQPKHCPVQPAVHPQASSFLNPNAKPFIPHHLAQQQQQQQLQQQQLQQQQQQQLQQQQKLQQQQGPAETRHSYNDCHIISEAKGNDCLEKLESADSHVTSDTPTSSESGLNELSEVTECEKDHAIVDDSSCDNTSCSQTSHGSETDEERAISPPSTELLAERCVEATAEPRSMAPSAVMYLSRRKKKTRPSSEKRRRRKLKQYPNDTPAERIQVASDPVVESDSDKPSEHLSSKISVFINPLDLDSESGSDSGSDWDEGETGEVCDLLPSSMTFLLHISACPSQSPSEHVRAANKRWSKAYDTVTHAIKQSKKQVHFPQNNDDLRTEHQVANNEEYSRRGPWEQYAADRFRFRDRVASLLPILAPVLDCSHRQRVFNARFIDAEFSS